MRPVSSISIFDEDALTRRFGRAIERDALTQPRFCFEDAAMASIARLLAADLSRSPALHELAGGGLLDALLAHLFNVTAAVHGRRRLPLSRQQLGLVTQHIEEHFGQTIRLSELAGLTGQSQSSFSHAFKAATGVAPHLWHMQVRVKQAQNMLAEGAAVKDVAAATGFADQAHFNRVFKSIVGMPPVAWLRG